MNVNELLRLIPSEVFWELAVETKVDAQVKKLSGEVMFKLILFSMLNSDKMSLRVMETFLHSAKFKSFFSQQSLALYTVENLHNTRRVCCCKKRIHISVTIA
jgi:hypothetical protein